jgi:hypothetical protein
MTVMFCDLVGSTGISAKLDAEDWRNLVNGYLDEASTGVNGFGGHVLKRLGDGLMVLFGYPVAQENDAERAVRAALAIQRSLADLNARNPAKGVSELSARIDIESGPVVVEAAGEVFGAAERSSAHSRSRRARFSERTGRVPLFVEEVTRLLLERGEQGGVQAIPSTLQQSLAARLDRLGPARDAAQIDAFERKPPSSALGISTVEGTGRWRSRT